MTTTTINAYEILFGAKKLGDESKITEARKLLAKLNVLYFDQASAEKSSELHAELSKKGEQLDIHDIFIGSIALANGCSLITRNIRHFSKIKGLKVEKW